jgi:predicted nucleotidyltransferase
MSPREAVAILGRRFAEQASEEARCARDIRATVPLVADVLVREFGVRRVVLFGSVARGAARPDSDIDIALEGLNPSNSTDRGPF